MNFPCAAQKKPAPNPLNALVANKIYVITSFRSQIGNFSDLGYSSYRLARIKLTINPEKQRHPKNMETGKLPIRFTTTAPKNEEIPKTK